MSSRPQSRVPSSSRPQPSTSLAVPKAEHTTTALSRLKHMFDTPRYCIFEAHVRLDELANVPQLEGGFTASWKFRGKKADKGVGNKPSLPNLKATASASAHSDLTSASSASLRSSPTPTSPLSPITPITATRPAANPDNSLLDASSRSKALSLPPQSVHPAASEDNPEAALRQPDKKTSDPTPLREVVTAPLRRTSSPEEMSAVDRANEPPELSEDGEGESSRRTSVESTRSSPGSGTGSARGSIGAQSLASSAAAPATAPSSRRGSLHPPLHASTLGNSPLASSSTPTLSKPFPKTLTTPARSGTSPSPAVILDSIPSIDQLPSSRPAPARPPVSRTVSQSTASTSTTSTGISSLIPRPRIVSGPGALGGKKNKPEPGYATSRKGTTPICQLKAHTVTWNYDLRYVVRVPLVKQANAGGVETPGRKIAGPMLGQGPLSESGFRLVFEQMPTDDHAGDKTPQAEAHTPPSNAPSRSQTNEKTEFGSVDIDLAPFAGKGMQTRRFLLRKSRTNAVVKLTIDVRWIGGETNYTTPPMTEGHHVSGVADLISDVSERTTNDMRLVRTGSNSSSSNSSTSHPSQTSSTINLVNLPQTHSAVNLSGHAPHMAYKSYEHHLRPADALRPSPKRDMSKLSQLSMTTARSSSPSSTPRHSPSRQVSSSHTPQSPEAGVQTPPASPTATKSQHDSHSTSPQTPSSPVMSLFGHHRHHRHHQHHLHHKRQDSVLGANKREMLPEEIIESLFNPRPSHEKTPFTFLQAERPAPTVTEPDEGASFIMIDPAAHTEGKTRPNVPGRWERMKARTASHRERKEKERLERTQTGVTAA